MKKFICNNKLQLMINKQFLVQIKNRPNRFRSNLKRNVLFLKGVYLSSMGDNFHL
jgi:hypothetical protein